MGFACGLVGLPNVGKSTLFNALAGRALAAAENYPFCTIEPHRERVPVWDERLERLAKMAPTDNVIFAQLDVVDIAGLVKGASKGEGLGNQFLDAIRHVQAIGHVVRCFDDEQITHVDGNVDPMRDIDTIETELLLADMDVLERKQAALVKRARGSDKHAQDTLDYVTRFLSVLHEGKAIRTLSLDEEAYAMALSMGLLSCRPMIYICNVDEASAHKGNALSKHVEAWAEERGCACFTLSALMEAELAGFTPEERREYLGSQGVQASGLEQFVQAGYAMLGLQTFFTVGVKEAKAWTYKRGATAVDAAGVIHTDFAKGFICAETVSYDDYLAGGSQAAVAAAGNVRKEGKDYVVQDGDVMHFRFQVARGGKAKA
ncbi:MAG: redox-regulated ATPase YchF [Alphaproteobacteria bacterium GM202ARS2]|nr:redox-regulated ATPase YchF [Alphaproteobacteria bacterium GM202ARS2]